MSLSPTSFVEDELFLVFEKLFNGIIIQPRNYDKPATDCSLFSF